MSPDQLRRHTQVKSLKQTLTVHPHPKCTACTCGPLNDDTLVGLCVGVWVVGWVVQPQNHQFQVGLLPLHPIKHCCLCLMCSIDRFYPICPALKDTAIRSSLHVLFQWTGDIIISLSAGWLSFQAVPINIHLATVPLETFYNRGITSTEA